MNDLISRLRKDRDDGRSDDDAFLKAEAADHLASLDDGCREFVRMQRELCELLDEDSEGDSLALHDRIVYGIKALKERADQPGREP